MRRYCLNFSLCDRKSIWNQLSLWRQTTFVLGSLHYIGEKPFTACKCCKQTVYFVTYFQLLKPVQVFILQFQVLGYKKTILSLWHFYIKTNKDILCHFQNFCNKIKNWPDDQQELLKEIFMTSRNCESCTIVAYCKSRLYRLYSCRKLFWTCTCQCLIIATLIIILMLVICLTFIRHLIVGTNWSLGQ